MQSIDLTPPLTIGPITLLRWIEGHTYESDTGATYYSGAAEPSHADADDCIATPRTLPPEPVPVPVQIGPAQLRIALLRLHQIAPATVDATIAGIIASIPDAAARTEAEIYAAKATGYVRTHPLVAAAAAVLGLDSAQIDAVYRLGATL
jgi:hypothetical protein